MEKSMTVFIAMVCHQANKAWCEANGDPSQKDWDEAEEWQRDSAINGVQFRIDNPNAGHDAQHNNWMKEKIEDGWVYGLKKDPEKKTHHCIVPFEELPVFQQKKDALFAGVCDSLLEKEDVFNFTGDMTPDMHMEMDVKADKHLRKRLDAQLQDLKRCPKSRERSLAITKLQESIMWLGMDLKRLNEPNPYPQSYNPGNTKIEKTADGLKL